MRTLPICLVALLLASSTPGLACGVGTDVAELVAFEIDMVDEALATAVVPAAVRADLLARLAAGESLLRDGAALRLVSTSGGEDEDASGGIDRQFEARKVVEGAMKELSLSIPVPLASVAAGCGAYSSAQSGIPLGARRRSGTDTPADAAEAGEGAHAGGKPGRVATGDDEAGRRAPAPACAQF